MDDIGIVMTSFGDVVTVILVVNSYPLSQICSDLSLAPKKAPFSENFRTHMLTHIVKVVPRGTFFAKISEVCQLTIYHSWDEKQGIPFGMCPIIRSQQID